MFQISQKSTVEFLRWQHEQDAKVVEIQRAAAKFKGLSIVPYYGTIGGSLVWCCRVHPDGRTEGWVRNDVTRDILHVEVIDFQMDQLPKIDHQEGHVYVWTSCGTTLGHVYHIIDETEGGEEQDVTNYENW